MNKVPENTRSACVLLGVLENTSPDLAFWRSRFGVLPLAFCPGVLGGAGVLGLAFWAPGVLGLAFWASGVLGLAFWAVWRSAWRSTLAFWGLAFWVAFSRTWRSAWRSGVLLGVLVLRRRLALFASL